jgi:type II secretory pathway pseudopilin PulG
MRLNKNIKGDTIIEVLICLAILGFIMTLAYSISNRSLQTIRRSQERIEALKLAEGQLELLKNLQKNQKSEYASTSGRSSSEPFCLYVADPSVPSDKGVQLFPASPAWSSEISTDDLSVNYTGKCSDQGSGNLYNIAIVPPGDVNGGVYKVYVRWEKFGGGANEQVTLEYKLYASN